MIECFYKASLYSTIKKSAVTKNHTKQYYKPTPLKDGLFCCQSRNIKRETPQMMYIEGHEVVLPIKIVYMEDGHFADMPYTVEEVEQILPELKDDNTFYCRYPKFEMKGTYRSFMAPMAITQENEKHIQRYLNKPKTLFDQYEFVFHNRNIPIGEIRKHLCVTLDEIRDIIDECIERFGCF